MPVWNPSLIDGIPPRHIARLAGWMVITLAASVLAGWLFDIASLRSLVAGGVAMKVNAAIGLLLCGVALPLLASPNHSGKSQLVAALAGVAAALLGLLTLTQDLSGQDFGIDQWLVLDTTPSGRTAIPGRMSPPTSFALMLAGTALVFGARPTSERLRNPTVLALAMVLVVIGGAAVLGRWSESLVDWRFLSYARIAFYTAAAFLLLGVGLVAVVRGKGGLRWSLDAATTSAFGVGVVVMIVTAGISYQFTSRLQQDAAQVGQAQELLNEVHELGGFLGEFTISAGRYLITRDERSLAGRDGTKAAIRAALERLRTLTAGNADDEQRLAEIERLHERRITMSDEIIARVRQQTLDGEVPPTGRVSPLGQEYPTLGFDIERLLKSVQTDAQSALAVRESKSATTARTTFLLLPLSAFIGMTILSLALFFMNANAAARVRANAHIARQRERLSLLHAIDQAIIDEKAPDQLARAILPRLRELLGLPRVVINMFDLEKGECEWLASAGRRRIHVGPGVRYSMELMGDLPSLQRGEMQLIDVEALKQRPEAEALLASGVRWYMVAPMIVGTELIGALSFGGPSRDFPAAQTEVAREVAAQIAIAIAHSRLAEHARRANARYRLIHENVPVGIAMTRTDGTLLSVNPTLVQMMGHASEMDAMATWASGLQGIYADPGARDAFLRRLHQRGTVSNFETRLMRKDGRPIWVSISAQRVHGVQGGVSSLVSIVEDITHRKEQEHRIRRLSRVKTMQSSVNSAIVRIRERDALLAEVCRIAVDQGGLRAAWVAWHDADAHLLRPLASAGHFDGFLDQLELRTDLPMDMPPSNTLVALRSGKSVVTDDLRTSPGVRFRPEALERGYLSAMHLPLVVDGAAEGVLVLYAAEANYFDDEERHLLDGLAADVSFALEALRKSEQLDYLAYYDPITDLPNRTLFHDRLEQGVRARQPLRMLAVALLDVERFRRINDSHGRHAGDTLLRDVGSRLRASNESVARLGADLYGIVLPDVRSLADAHRAVEAIVVACFTAPYDVGDTELRVACRAALSVFPHDGADADALLRNAEAAMRLGKRTDERIVFYAPEMNARVAEALAVETRLRGAISRREFVLHYQPKVNLADGHVIGMEALIRWRDPTHGLLPPGRFVPILEETGLIANVGAWVVEQAFADARRWAAAGIDVPRIAVNVSAIQLHRSDFLDNIINAIQQGGDLPELLELEVTESIVMSDVKESTNKLAILRGMGIKIAIDDFGTGYSSLSYLTRLPVDALKIDRSFVSGMSSSIESRSIVSTIIALGHGLGLDVVAEGVETPEQRETLRQFACDHAQGFLFARPMPADEIEALLRRGVPLPAG